MRRIFQRVSLLDLARTDYYARRSSKISIILGFMMIFLSFVPSSLSQPLNNFNPGSEPEGFGKIHWGVDFPTLEGMEYSRKDPSYGGIEIYRKIWDDACPCGVIVKNIDYLFWKGKFLGICFFEEGFSGYEHLRKAVSEIFGEGKKPFTDQQYYLWEGDKTFMALEYNSVGEKILFWMMGTSMLRQMEGRDKE